MDKEDTKKRQELHRTRRSTCTKKKPDRFNPGSSQVTRPSPRKRRIIKSKAARANRKLKNGKYGRKR